jgi:ribonuclease D
LASQDDSEILMDKRTPEIITKDAALADLCSRISASGMFAFDTEFVGEECYQAEVCLVQVATDSFCALIDPMGGLDLSPFWELAADERIRVIVHAGSEDLAICWKQLGRAAANVFDLQVAAGLVGFGYPVSLSRLAQATVHARIHKSQTLSDWRKRPLTDEQIDYAVEDVVHLPRIYRVLEDRLAAMGRESWAKEESAAMCAPCHFAPTGDQKLRRLRGTGSLTAQELAITEALLDERDKLAQEYDRPARGVLRDHLLLEMARRGWTEVAKLRSLRGLNLSASALRRLAEAIQRAKNLPREAWPQPTSDEDTPQEEVLIALTTAVLRDYCGHNSLSFSLLANKQDLRNFVRGHTRRAHSPPPSALTGGWRGAAVGSLLEQFITGRCALRVGPAASGYRLLVE